ncbi:MAG TPA: YicC/YloC family endoribonuclease [Sphingobacteriaceae bacterium]|nr:YicC/YloC family endoribonuclease [Sphingobacteriaceae bacterium]
MIKSMTGYGAGSASDDKVKYSVELKSLNSKFLELGMRLPKAVADKELQIRGACAKRIERGKVNLSIDVEYSDQTAHAARINAVLFEKYYLQLQELAQQTGSAVEAGDLFRMAMTLPEVVNQEEQSADEQEGELLMQAFEQAFEAFDRFRRDEGAVLKEELKGRVQGILELLTQVEAEETDRVPLIRERISQYLDRTVGRENVDMNRFEQELIYYIDKLDITEEKVRLRSHCQYFLQALDATDANGKKLGFISQEIGREINTLGSKANHAGIQQMVIRMKEELEKVKEQLLNVL